ncbi:hypothetical protein ACVIU7_004765 [Bradyrhizobium liaoningense]|nr:hypothetical protein GCM10007858_26200 [Bradyrhizobium liaoningense]
MALSAGSLCLTWTVRWSGTPIILLKVEGADTQFMVGDQVTPLTDTAAVLVDGWKPHAYVHHVSRPRTLIMALYVEPEWLKEFRPGWPRVAHPVFSSGAQARCRRASSS